MKKIKLISLVLALTMTAAAFTGCKDNKNPNEGQEESSETRSEVSSEVSSEPKDEEEAVNEICSPFTGEAGYDESLLLKRPAVVMLSNIYPALPQKGISEADIIYQLPVEGAITRLMAVFSDYESLPDVGSVRSARHDFVELARPLDPIYMHFGSSVSGSAAIEEYGIDNISGTKLARIAYYQDPDRVGKVAQEHTFFSNAEYLKKGIEFEKYRTALENPLAPVFKFAKADENANADAPISAKEAVFKMSGGDTATFTYLEETGKYKKGQFGADHIDGKTGEAVQIDNVFLLYTDVSLMADKLHKEVRLEEGTGYYLSRGKAKKITFKKKDAYSLMQFFDENGEELLVNRGKTWVAVAPDGFEENFKIN